MGDSLFLAGATLTPDQHAPDAVERDEVPVRPLPELLFDCRRPAVDLAPMRTDVLCFQDADAQVEPRPLLRDRTSEVLADELRWG